MRHPILIALALLACAFAASADPAPNPPLAMSKDALALVQALAEKPFSAVVDGKCEIRGAVWAGGPRAGVNVELLGVDGSAHKAVTGPAGFYSLSIAYASPMVFQERIADAVRVRNELKDKVQVVSPAVVCDHRANQPLPSSLATQKE